MYQKRTNKKDSAVSPVVGVMLMLVVTIIIAAVVATVSTGLMTGVEKTPSITLDSKLSGGNLEIEVFSVSEPIDGSNLKIVLAATNETGYHAAIVDGSFLVTGKGAKSIAGDILSNAVIYGGNTISGNVYTGIIKEYNYDDDYEIVNKTGIEKKVQRDPTTSTVKSTWRWAGKPDSDPEYLTYNKLGNKIGTPTHDPWAMVLFKSGWSLTSKNPWLVSHAIKGAELVSGDKLKIDIVYTPSGQTIYSDTLVVS